jgi:glucose/arabinose dehydrogenase
VAVPNAMTAASPQPLHTVASGGDLQHPLAMTTAPNGDLLVTNGLNGDVVEVTTSGRQVAHMAIDPDPAQSPPGSGDLFGLAATPTGVYFAKDDTNTLGYLHP